MTAPSDLSRRHIRRHTAIFECLEMPFQLKISPAQALSSWLSQADQQTQELLADDRHPFRRSPCITLTTHWPSRTTPKPSIDPRQHVCFDCCRPCALAFSEGLSFARGYGGERFKIIKLNQFDQFERIFRLLAEKSASYHRYNVVVCQTVTTTFSRSDVDGLSV